jgi:hypothetical protein
MVPSLSSEKGTAMRKKYERLNYESHNRKPILPPIDILDAKQGYFVHNGDVYAVKNASDAVFRSAVLALAPYWRSAPQYSSLLADDMDLYSKWYLLCALSDSNRPMTLYSSREAAEQACGVAA